MEDIDGGLHPAVDGQSLDEDEDEEESLWTFESKELFGSPFVLNS